MRKIIPLLLAFALILLCGCEIQPQPADTPPEVETPAASTADGGLELSYAHEFTVDYIGNAAVVTIGGADKYVVLGQSDAVPEGFEDAVVIRKPLRNIYLAASSAMDFFRQLDELGTVRLTSTDYYDWSIPEVRNWLDSGSMLYAGHYSKPDYELLLSENADLAIESTMIYHSPETKERLTEIGIPVLVERSSYETDPLGRMEWIKLYGLLTGKLAEAEEFFNDQVEVFNSVIGSQTEGERPVAAFFYITANGEVNVRKSTDYVVKLIDFAGGQYFLDGSNDGDSKLSTTNLEFEAFYTLAKDADVIIYNSNVDGDVETVDQLLGKNALLGDFKAVQNGNVWCTSHSMFQETTGAADLLKDLRAVISGEADGELRFLHRVD